MRSAIVAFVLVALVASGCGDSGGGEGTATTVPTEAGVTTGLQPGGADYLDGGFPPRTEPVRGGMLRAALNEDIDCWNGLSYLAPSWTIFAFAGRGLYGTPNTVQRPAAGELQPDLAHDLPRISADGLTVEVRLRDGLRFPDGSPVGAGDVKATFEHLLDPRAQCASGGPPASRWYAGIVGVDDYIAARADGTDDARLVGIEVVDPLTVAFRLAQPDPTFVRALALPWAFIRQAAGISATARVPGPFVGPYRIVEHARGRALRVEREPSWAANVTAGAPEQPGENMLDGVEVAIGLTDAEQLDGLRADTLDLSLDGAAPTGSEVAAAAADPALAERLFSTPSDGLVYAVLRADREPFSRYEARRAVNLAIDRRALARIIGGPLAARPWSQLLPASLAPGQPSDLYARDVSRARALVDSSGVRGPARRVTLAHPAEAPGPALARALRRDLERIGLRVQLRAFAGGAYYGVLADPSAAFDLAIVSWTPDWPDASAVFGPLLTCGAGANLGRWCDPALDARVAEVGALPLGAERTAQFAALGTRTALEEAPWATLVAERRVSLVSSRLGNYLWGPVKGPYLAVAYLTDAPGAG